jgi:cysteine synthase A
MDAGRERSTDQGTDCEFRGRIYDSILDTVGATPLVLISKMAAERGVKA